MVRVLFVCRGNQCRSPLAEALFTAAVGAQGGWRVGSAGTAAANGALLVGACTEHLPDRTFATAFRTRRLTAGLVADADVVVTMTRSQAGDVLRLDPTALRRTATLAELARCAARTRRSEFTAGGPALRRLLELTIRDRGPCRPARPQDDDIPDPVGDTGKLLRAVVRTITEAVDQVTAVLLPAYPSTDLDLPVPAPPGRTPPARTPSARSGRTPSPVRRHSA